MLASTEALRVLRSRYIRATVPVVYAVYSCVVFNVAIVTAHTHTHTKPLSVDARHRRRSRYRAPEIAPNFSFLARFQPRSHYRASYDRNRSPIRGRRSRFVCHLLRFNARFALCRFYRARARECRWRSRRSRFSLPNNIVIQYNRMYSRTIVHATTLSSTKRSLLCVHACMRASLRKIRKSAVN